MPAKSVKWSMTCRVRRTEKESKKPCHLNDPSVSGREVLRLARKEGKGWFALLLSEKLHADTFIPEYILRAIAFAADGLSAEAVKRMGLFRIADDFFDVGVRGQFPEMDELKQMPMEEFIYLFRELAPEDNLSEFVRYLEEYRHV